ncbi:MAG: GDSL-type esterase/lipase family protein [Magnetospirillum sp.]|nr:GDSL-type esterase/lipase family protein [Magnetospirillum sp.]
MRICFIGDSFVNGTNDPLCLGWVGRVAARARQQGTDLTVYNLGIRRDTSRDVAARWRAESLARLPAEHPGALVFSFGVNDCCDEAGRRRVAAKDSLALAGQILRQAAARHPTLMVGPPPIADDAINVRIASLSVGLDEVCGALSVPFLAIFASLDRHSTWRDEAANGDGAHPGAGGYDALAELVAAWPAWQRLLAG